jgi:hypothetical protein
LNEVCGILERASTSRPSDEWSDNDYDVLADSAVVGRIMKGVEPEGTPWLWTLAYGQHKDRSPTHGYEATGEAEIHKPGLLPLFHGFDACCAVFNKNALYQNLFARFRRGKAKVTLIANYKVPIKAQSNAKLALMDIQHKSMLAIINGLREICLVPEEPASVHHGIIRIFVK